MQAQCPATSFEDAEGFPREDNITDILNRFGAIRDCARFEEAFARLPYHASTAPRSRIVDLKIFERKKATPPEPKSQDVGIENSLKYVRCFQHLV